jgi:branched-chain amino acid transport system ATP-binding protein
MREAGIAVLLVEQNLRAAVEIAGRAYMLDDGGIVFEGPAAEFAHNAARDRAIAGVSAELWETGTATA